MCTSVAERTDWWVSGSSYSADSGLSQSLQEVHASTEDWQSEPSMQQFAALGGQGWMWFVKIPMS
jgi:hypothetical protein